LCFYIIIIAVFAVEVIELPKDCLIISFIGFPWPCRNSGDWSPASHLAGLVSIPLQGFVVDKVALGQVFSEYFGFRYQFSFHQQFHTHHHLSSGAGTICQKLWPTYHVNSVSSHPKNYLLSLAYAGIQTNKVSYT
jgi:hypothetical protein